MRFSEVPQCASNFPFTHWNTLKRLRLQRKAALAHKRQQSTVSIKRRIRVGKGLTKNVTLEYPIEAIIQI